MTANDLHSQYVPRSENHPRTGSHTWVEFDGILKTFKIWDGRAQIEQFETDSPTAGRIEGLTLRTYDPTAHEWRLSWANSKIGRPGIRRRSELLQGWPRRILLPGLYRRPDDFDSLHRWDITPNSAHFEQSFSDDGGKTWEVNWITDQTRVSEEAFNAMAQRYTTAADKITSGDATESNCRPARFRSALGQSGNSS